ncbi:hypothetical protein LTR66_014627, partial [Elasticomyces elasticus]
MSSTPLPPGYSAPLALVDGDNHGAWVIITNAFGLILVLICLLIRLYIRRVASPPFAKDDTVLSAATALAVVQAALVFAQVHAGLGKSMALIDAAQLVKIQKLTQATKQKLVYAADIFYLIVVYLSKISVVFLFMRLSPNESHTRVAWAVLASCAALCTISVFLVALHCDLRFPWIQFAVKCTSLAAQWTAVAVFDVVTELALFGMAVQLVSGLLTKWSRKGRVVVAFGLRLPVAALAIIRLYYIHKQTRSPDPTLQAAITAILTQLEMYYGIMGATIPCLRPFLSGFETNFGAMG